MECRLKGCQNYLVFWTQSIPWKRDSMPLGDMGSKKCIIPIAQQNMAPSKFKLKAYTIHLVYSVMSSLN